VVRGIGDDCAVVRPDGLAFTSVDCMVEQVHFRRGWLEPFELGWRALAAALSDLAAMAVPPGEAYLALGLPGDFGEPAALELARGAKDLAKRHGLAIVGGDVVASPALFVCVTVVGWCREGERWVGRDGARPGELLAVTGSLGGPAAAVSWLEAGLDPQPHRQLEPFARLRRPEPRIAAGRALADAGVSAMVDLSDGVAEDGRQLAAASGSRLALELERLPLAEGVERLARELGLDPKRIAATGGEDYELLCALPPSRLDQARSALGRLGLELSVVGRVIDGAPGVEFRDRNGKVLALRGYEHRL